MTADEIKAYAAALIGTKCKPDGLDKIVAKAREARAYFSLKPYPEWWFWDWKVEDRGPLPRALPASKTIVLRGARWLFGKPIQITVPGNAALETALQKAWEANQMDANMVPLAQDAALDGGYVLKFAYDDTAVAKKSGKRKPAKISIQSLSLTDQVRLYYNPHDCSELLMARVQYSYPDAVQGATMWYREEWTAEELVTYKPLKATDLGNAGDPDTFEGWIIDQRQPNPFELIPLLPVKNVASTGTWSTGDLWDSYRVLDRIHLTYHLMDRSNQFDSEINPIYIDLEPEEDDADKPQAPGQALILKSDKDGGANTQGSVILPEARGALRPAMQEYAKDLLAQVRAAAGNVEVDQTEITNVGNMTVAVLRQVYQAQIEITDEKRKSQGTNGVAAFLSLMALGLSNAGVSGLGVDEADEDSYAVVVKFADYFELSEDEKEIKTGRLQEEELAGYVTHERAIEECAAIEGRQDVAALKDELAKEPSPSPTEGIEPNPADPGATQPPTVKAAVRVK